MELEEALAVMVVEDSEDGWKTETFGAGLGRSGRATGAD